MDRVIDGMLKGAQTGAILQQGQVMKAEADRIRAETDLLRLRAEAMKKETGTQPPDLHSSAMMWAWIRSQQRIPEIIRYRAEMERLMRMFSDPSQVTSDQVLEGFYLMARYASFSQGKQPVEGARVEKARPSLDFRQQPLPK